MHPTPLIPSEGWPVLHLFYRIDQLAWLDHSEKERQQLQQNFIDLIATIRAQQSTQLLTLGVLTPRADIGFMLTTPDLDEAHALEKQLTTSLGPGVLDPTYHYLSMTESSEYTTTPEEYAASLPRTRDIQPDTPEFAEAMEQFSTHQEKYLRDRLYPNLADWPLFCFYPMNKRRGEDKNWYALDFDARKKLMSGHATIGRQWAGKIRQLITGSTGLDDYEWGVTLFAKDLLHIKQIVYQMRFDEVSALYGEFGPFYIGIQHTPETLLERHLLTTP